MATVETSQDSDEEYEYVYTVNYVESKKPPMCRVRIDGNVVEMMIDSGVSVNLLDETTFQRINDGLLTTRFIDMDLQPLYLC